MSSYLIHTKSYRDTNGNTYSSTRCYQGHTLALRIPKGYGAPEDQQLRVMDKLSENEGLSGIRSFWELEGALEATIYRISERTTAKAVREWGSQ